MKKALNEIMVNSQN